ncbi:unnamed protein product, partial [Gongylonema pulchrum]|uniref:Phlebovirus_G2 domain-containing protein n=1 Tax=Gongylonema pulchrum TaxID=637853 RepID=A0A183E9R6_9BILA
PSYKYCIYGIKYYRNSSGFVDTLYFNDDKYPWSTTDVTHLEFEKAARPLCTDLASYANDTLPFNALYYSAWVLWRIILKLHFLIRRKYSLMKNYILEQVPGGVEGKELYVDETYYITNRMPEADDYVVTCNKANLRRVPLTSNNNVCFVTANDTVEAVTVYNRQFEQPSNLTAHDILQLGPYSATKMLYMKDLQCRIEHTFDDYGYECCCYGDNIDNCQERVSNSILVGKSQLTIYGEVMMCVTGYPDANASVQYHFNGANGRITIRGKMQIVLDVLRTKSVIILYLFFDNFVLFFVKKECGERLKTK